MIFQLFKHRMSSFETLGVSRATTAILAKHGISAPTPIQLETLPPIFDGKDVIAQAETGSGKTLSFALPLIEKIERGSGVSALILAPTRELAVQIAGEFAKFSTGKHLGIAPVYGGVSINEQVKNLERANIVVATPGRLLDLLNRKSLKLSGIRFLVFDEADRMLDMGFLPDIERILRHVPKERQTMLFSATISKEIIQVSQRYLRHPKEIRLASEVKPEFLRQTYYQTSPDQKMQLLMHLLKHERDLALVFTNRKHIAKKLASRLSSQGVHAKALQGDMTQGQRERATADFKAKKFNVLVATDVAARGLHIEDITHVYNYEIPRDVDSYTHRVGRTARAGKRGEAISIVATDEERKFFKQILFTYSGNITLKTVDAGELPRLVEVPRSEGRPHRQRSPQQGRDRRRRR
jgi:ATP-dependent RNA helicase DeaD